MWKLVWFFLAAQFTKAPSYPVSISTIVYIFSILLRLFNTPNKKLKGKALFSLGIYSTHILLAIPQEDYKGKGKKKKKKAASNKGSPDTKIWTRIYTTEHK